MTSNTILTGNTPEDISHWPTKLNNAVDQFILLEEGKYPAFTRSDLFNHHMAVSSGTKILDKITTRASDDIFIPSVMLVGSLFGLASANQADGVVLGAILGFSIGCLVKELINFPSPEQRHKEYTSI